MRRVSGIVVQTTNSSDHNAIDPNLVADQSGAWWLVLDRHQDGPARPGDRQTGEQHPLHPGASPVVRPLLPRHQRHLPGRGGPPDGRHGPCTDRNGVRRTSGGGTEVLATHGSVVGPGRQALLPGSDGWLMAYHYYTPRAADWA
jgi:arabinan endo-1,5-alpha-L-arabinosidase